MRKGRGDERERKDSSETDSARRRALSMLGLSAATAFTAPALLTLKKAQASDDSTDLELAASNDLSTDKVADASADVSTDA